MKLNYPILSRGAGLLGSAILYRYMSTLDSRYVLADDFMDPKGPCHWPNYLYAFWHEYILYPTAFFGHCNVAALTSLHADAEIVTHLAHFMGFQIVRGSTTRGGVEALRSMMKYASHGHITIMPDGPRGPRREMAPGAIFLASKLHIPLVMVGMSYDRPWRVNSWDRFAIPRPFSRARMVFSPALYIPDKLGRDGLRHFQYQAEHIMAQATQEADKWASDGLPRAGERALVYSPKMIRPYCWPYPEDDTWRDDHLHYDLQKPSEKE